MNTDDPAARPKRPKTKARLEQLITQWQKDSGYPVSRLNLRIAAMMIAGALARVVDPEGRAAFATKGGIAMELRMRGQARATNDIDLVLRGDPDQLWFLTRVGRLPRNSMLSRRNTPMATTTPGSVTSLIFSCWRPWNPISRR